MVSWGCHDKFPQTGWLKATKMYYLTALWVGSVKSRHQQGHSSSYSLWGEPFLPLPAPVGPKKGGNFSFLSFPFIGFISHLEILNVITSSKIFPNKVKFTGSEWTYCFEAHYSINHRILVYFYLPFRLWQKWSFSLHNLWFEVINIPMFYQNMSFIFITFFKFYWDTIDV